MSDVKTEAPPNIDELVRKSRSKVSWEDRRDIVNELGKWKCQQSIDVLQNLLKTDKVYDVRVAAHRSLQKLGFKDVRLGKRQPPYTVKEIQKVFARAKRESKIEEPTAQDIINKLLQTNQEVYDVMKYEKGDKFEEWVANTLRSLPKK